MTASSSSKRSSAKPLAAEVPPTLTAKQLTSAERRRIELPYRVAAQALKFVPEYRAWWMGLKRVAGREGTVREVLERWRIGGLPKGHRFVEIFGEACFLVEPISRLGPVDPEDLHDLPVERIWRETEWTTGMAVAPPKWDSFVEEAVGAFGVLPATADVERFMSSPDQPRPGVHLVYLDLNFGPTDLARGIELLRRIYGTESSEKPGKARTWDGEGGSWEIAFRLFDLVTKKPDLTWPQLARAVGLTERSELNNPGELARSLANAAADEVRRIRGQLEGWFGVVQQDTPNARRKRGRRTKSKSVRAPRTAPDPNL